MECSQLAAGPPPMPVRQDIITTTMPNYTNFVKGLVLKKCEKMFLYTKISSNFAFCKFHNRFV
jgi:hypothetical protein